MCVDQTNSKNSCLDFSIAGLHRIYSENSIHFFDSPQISADMIHSGKSSDSISGALGQPVQQIHVLSVKNNSYGFFLKAYIAILDINRLGTVGMRPANTC
jgi:hypothetical protein